MEPFLEVSRWFWPSEFYVALPFWGYFAVAVLLYRASPSSAGLKDWLLLTCSVCMLLLLPRFDLSMLAVLLGLCGVAYACARRLLVSGEGTAGSTGRILIATAGISVILCALLFFKYRFVQAAILGPPVAAQSGAESFVILIGISYSSFRAMHFVIEAYKRTLKKPGLLRFLNYMLFFPSFISGPINRYNDYSDNASAASKTPFREDLAAGLERIVHGLFKKTVLAVVLWPYTIGNLGTPIQGLNPWQLMLGLYAFALYLYVDFSGYTDLAIGCGRLMGFKLPENFDWPFLKRNIQQLWAHWHMSLTGWLTDYIYWPLVRRLREGDFLRRHPIVLSNLAILVTFLICGLWHGETFGFVLWGLYQGIGIAAVNTYQSWKRRVRHPLARRYFASAFSHALGVFLTFNFFALGLLPFALDAGQVGSLLARLF